MNWFKRACFGILTLYVLPVSSCSKLKNAFFFTGRCFICWICFGMYSISYSFISLLSSKVLPVSGEPICIFKSLAELMGLLWAARPIILLYWTYRYSIRFYWFYHCFIIILDCSIVILHCSVNASSCLFHWIWFYCNIICVLWHTIVIMLDWYEWKASYKYTYTFWKFCSIVHWL